MTEEFLFKIHNHVEIYICIKMSEKSFFFYDAYTNDIQSIQKKLWIVYIPRVLLLAHESKSVNYLTNLIIKRNNILSHSHCERRSVNYLLKN